LIGQNSVGAGDPGPLVVRAGEVTLRDGGAISGVTGSGGNGADILLEAGRLVIDGGRLDSNALPTSTAERAGNVTVIADEVVATRDGVIQSSTLSGTDAGRVRIEADRVTLTDGGLVQSDTSARVPRAAWRSRPAGSSSAAASTRQGSPASPPTAARGGPGVRRGLGAEVEISDAGTIQSGTFGPSAAGSVRVAANDVRIRSGGSITTNTGSSAPAGEIRIEAGRLSINGAGAGDSLTGVASASASPTGGATGPAGGISIAAREVDVDRGFVTTAGAGAEGGRIEVAADRVILLDDAVVTSTGITPAPGASLITLRAPTIVLNDSRVTSLTGAGTPLGGSGEASLLGDVTVISADSLVAASSSVVTTGLQTDLGTELQLAPGAFLDAGDLLGQGCAARRTGKASSFTRAGRGGLPPSPDRPLASRVRRARRAAPPRPGG
jgi:hypothetical protein